MSDVDIDTILDAATFEPLTQIFVLRDRYGQEIEIPLDAVARYVRDGIIQNIVFASQIGAAAAVLVILLILTRSEKRRSPVFALNCFALVFTVIAEVLSCLYYTSAWYAPYSFFTSDYSFIRPSDKATQITSGIFVLLLVVTIEASLVYQVHVVSVTLDRWKRVSVLFVSTAVALAAIAFRLTTVVDNIINNIISEQYNYQSRWLGQARDIALAVSICFFSFVFCVKLGWSLRERRKMGLTQFGPMQIIFIGGAQTLIIPAIFAIVQFIAPTSRVNSFILTITATSLPLTSLWASAATAHPAKAARGPDAQHKFILPSSTADSSFGNSALTFDEKGLKQKKGPSIFSALSRSRLRGTEKGSHGSSNSGNGEQGLGHSVGFGTHASAMGSNAGVDKDMDGIEVERQFGSDVRERDLEMQDLGQAK